MTFRNFDRAQAEFERRRNMTEEDKAEEREVRRLRKEFEEERADYLRDLQKDNREIRRDMNFE